MQAGTQIKTTSNKAGNKNWRVLWNLTRPHTLTASFVPVILGTVMTLEHGEINISLFISMLVASILIQAATNMFNEYFDYKRGLDNEESVGIGGAIVRDGIHPKIILKLAWTLVGLAILLGIYICANSSWWIALIGSISIMVGYLYTGGPFPIAYTPLGELMSGLFMGINIILISFFIQTGFITITSILVSVPVTILIGAINLSNNIRDLDGDKENGRKTLAILIGRKNAVRLLASMFFLAYAWVFLLVFYFDLTPFLLIVLLSFPKPVAAVKGYIGKTVPVEMMPAMKATAQTNTFFGFLLSAGFICSYFFPI